MRKISTSIVGAIALVISGAAYAADLPVKARPMTPAPAFSWTGLYIGANGGYGSSHNCWDFTTPAGVFVAAEGCTRATGGVAGGQIGYRWQTGALVFGVEAQGDWADLSGRRISSAFPAFTNETRINSFGLFTGQVGYAWNNVLLYVRGGAAVTDNEYRSFVTATNILSSRVDETRWGGAVGVGLEYGFTPNWSVAVAYDHLFMGDTLNRFLNNGVSGAPGTLFGTDRIDQDVDLVTVRVNYRFGGGFLGMY